MTFTTFAIIVLFVAVAYNTGCYLFLQDRIERQNKLIHALAVAAHRDSEHMLQLLPVVIAQTTALKTISEAVGDLKHAESVRSAY